ncbi:hypothetical protein V1477_005960 [Vespula maculifrons]|uniref:Uncharacterized protein n=1 Tax=Vespula maculifrons TaxID=7453 RepID=A0ABD2CL66_VESMC
MIRFLESMLFNSSVFASTDQGARGRIEQSSSAGNSSSISSRSISSSSTSSSSSSISISSRSSTEAVAVTAVEVFVFSGAGGGSWYEGLTLAAVIECIHDEWRRSKVSTKQKLQEEKTNEGESCDISDMCKIVLHEEEERVPNKRDGSNDSARKRQLCKIDKNCHSRADVKGTESSTRGTEKMSKKCGWMDGWMEIST